MDVNANSKLKRKKKTHGLVSWAVCWLMFRVGVRIVRWKTLDCPTWAWTWCDVCVVYSHLKFDRGFGERATCIYFLGQDSSEIRYSLLNLVFSTVFSGLGTRRNDIEIDLTPSWITWRGCCRSLKKSSRNSIKFLFSDSQWAIWGPRVSFKVINVLHLFLSRYACWFTCIANIFFLFETLWCWLLPWIIFLSLVDLNFANFSTREIAEFLVFYDIWNW